MRLKTTSTLLPPTFFRYFGFISLLFLSGTVCSAEVHQTNNIHIRTLAASCAACHGTHGNSHSTTPVLAGLDATYFSNQMLAFKNGGRSSTVMHHHAKGLTDDEIMQLSHFFSEQKRVSTPPPVSQQLKAIHE